MSHKSIKLKWAETPTAFDTLKVQDTKHPPCSLAGQTLPTYLHPLRRFGFHCSSARDTNFTSFGVPRGKMSRKLKFRGKCVKMKDTNLICRNSNRRQGRKWILPFADWLTGCRPASLGGTYKYSEWQLPSKMYTANVTASGHAPRPFPPREESPDCKYQYSSLGKRPSLPYGTYRHA